MIPHSRRPVGQVHGILENRYPSSEFWFFMDSTLDYRNHSDGFLFDLDGTIYLGEHALPGAVETVAELRRMGKHILFVSNKPLASRHDYSDKLFHLGIPASPEDIITSVSVLGGYLKEHFPHLRLYVIGEEYLKEELRLHGLVLTGELWDQDEKQVIDPHGIDAVVVAFDRTLNYRKLNTAYQALLRGARFFATNADKACPMPGGSIPDAGATIVTLEYLSGRKLDLLAGKPSSLMIQAALDRLNLPPGNCWMVGDRLETDIVMGREAGMNTALVLTGATRREQLKEYSERPTLILEKISDLLEYVKS
jgi:phosphoglycolate/pyridoxal phosphate phosphatase family enzyme